MNYTTIQIKETTREKLAKFKVNQKETYDELLNSLMELVPSEDDEGKYTNEFKAALMRGHAFYNQQPKNNKEAKLLMFEKEI